MKRWRRGAALIAVSGICLTGAACGARYSPQVRSALANQTLGGGNGGSGTVAGGGSSLGTGAGSSSSIGPSGGGGGGSGGTAPVTGPGGGTQSGSGSGKGAANGTAPRASSGAGGNQGSNASGSGGHCPATAKDVGISGNTINLGTIADLTGPVNGLFEGAVQGVEAFANYVNSTGGICGHGLHFDVADSQTSCTAYQNDMQNLIKKDFAFVGSFALYDGCGASVLKANPKVADLHTGLNPEAISPANHFDMAAGTAGAPTGPFAYWAHKYPSQVKHAGTIAENVPSALQEQHHFVHAAESVGWKFVYTDNAAPTSTDFTSQFQAMCQRDHVQVVYIETETAQNAATMMQNENQAGCPPSLINVIPIAYDQAFLADYQGNKASLHVLGYNEFPLFFNADDAAHIPELKLFQTWFARSNPGKTSSLYALYGWIYGRMFEDAYLHAGSTLNRATFIAALRKLKNFDADGMYAPSDPSTKTSGAHCYVLWQLSGGRYSRVDTPANGYRCDGTFLRDPNS